MSEPSQEAAADQPFAPIHRRLEHPVKIVFNAGKDNERVEELAELAMRADIEAGDMMAADGHEGENAKMIALIAQLTGQPFAVIKRLKKADYGFFVERLMEL